MKEYSVKNKVVIVTGATKGMGLATSEQLLKMGAKVTMVYAHDTKNATEIEKKLTPYANQFLILKADITLESDRLHILKATLKKFNEVNVLVNNAGIPAKNKFLKEKEEDFDRIINVNLKAPIFLAKLVSKQMIEQKTGGSIINFSSISGHRAMGGTSYDAAKSGIIRASQSMAIVLGKYGIRVNSISPGTHKTEMNRALWESKADLFKSMCAATALKRAAEAEEVAGTVVYLASDQSSYTTGTDILVDGGYLSYPTGR